MHTLLLSGLIDTLRIQVPSRSVAGCGCSPTRVKLGFSLANQLTFPKGVLAFEFTTAI